MARNKDKKDTEELPPKLKVRGKMTGEQYWKWRLTIEEGDLAKSKAECAHLKCQLKVLEIEKNNLQLTLSRKNYLESQLTIKQSVNEYAKVKEEIEFELGISLDNCSINPYTFEIQELPDKD